MGWELVAQVLVLLVSIAAIGVAFVWVTTHLF